MVSLAQTLAGDSPQLPPKESEKNAGTNAKKVIRLLVINITVVQLNVFFQIILYKKSFGSQYFCCPYTLLYLPLFLTGIIKKYT